MIDILREMMIENIDKKVTEFVDQKHIYEYNALQLQRIVDKLKNHEDLNTVQKAYLEIFELI